MKKLERIEVLRQVRFANKNYDPLNDVVYSEDMRNINDLEVIRYGCKSWVEGKRIRNDVYFISLEDLRIGNYENLIVIENDDLMHLTDCGYGYLKG